MRICSRATEKIESLVLSSFGFLYVGPPIFDRSLSASLRKTSMNQQNNNGVINARNITKRKKKNRLHVLFSLYLFGKHFGNSKQIVPERW